MKNMVSVAVLFALSSHYSVWDLWQMQMKTPSDEFRVGMEAGYAPFNWSQQTDENNALPIQGQIVTPAVMMFKSLKVADGLGKISHRPNEMGWSGSCPSIRQDRRDHRRNEPYC